MNNQKGFVVNSIALAVVMQLSACGSSDAGTSDNAPPVSEEPVITDTTAPVITLRGNDSIEVVFNAVFGDLGATAIDDIDGEVQVSVAGSVDTQTPGVYELTYSATDATGNSAQMTRTVNVLEDTSPTATVNTPAAVPAFMYDGTLKDADYWSATPAILSAGMGFDGTVGIAAEELTSDSVQAAGGAWSSDINCGTDTRNYTATSTLQQVGAAYIQQVPYGELKDGAIGLDGLPIVLSWPIDTRTLSLTDFQFTLNTGDIVRPLAVGPFPNFEDNERNTPVVFGEFGNRLPSSDPDARFPIKLEIVADDTPLMMMGPDNQMISAVGLTWETNSSPYDDNNGPRLVGAKLNRIDGVMTGEGLSTPQPLIPANDASVMYDEGDFMLRMLTTGGFSPDGVSGVKPNEFERFFRIHAIGEGGSVVIIDKVNEEFQVAGGTLRVVGLSDLGQPEGGEVQFDACYDEDLDNYIDIILVGDEDAARSITHLEIPSLEEGYDAFYNPGGPGRTPFDGVMYSQPGPRDLEPVIMALDDPMRVTYLPSQNVNPPAASEVSATQETFEFDGVQRNYLLTLSPDYTGDEAVPLLFDFHGLNGTAAQQATDSRFDVIAQRENFILVTPQAVNGIWNVSGFPVSGSEDDLGFVTALIDELAAKYNINTNRIYAAGMSLGGFMSVELACNHSDVFAAIATVSAVMTPTQQQFCAPQRPISVLQTHGTADEQIPYVQSGVIVEWWIAMNQTDAEPVVTSLPDPFPDNGTSVTRYAYGNGTHGTSVVHLQIDGGQHVWPGSDGDSDINMAEAIWDFVSRYDVNGLITD